MRRASSAEQLNCRLLAINVSKHLPVSVAQHKARGRFLDGPGRREAAGNCPGMEEAAGGSRREVAVILNRVPPGLDAALVETSSIRETKSLQALEGGKEFVAPCVSLAVGSPINCSRIFSLFEIIRRIWVRSANLQSVIVFVL
jgi:hypothetical protein